MVNSCVDPGTSFNWVIALITPLGCCQWCWGHYNHDTTPLSCDPIGSFANATAPVSSFEISVWSSKAANLTGSWLPLACHNQHLSFPPLLTYSYHLLKPKLAFTVQRNTLTHPHHRIYIEKLKNIDIWILWIGKSPPELSTLSRTFVLILSHSYIYVRRLILISNRGHVHIQKIKAFSLK